LKGNLNYEGDYVKFEGYQCDEIVEKAKQKIIIKQTRFQRRERGEQIKIAQNLEEAERYEEAAEIYEEIGEWGKAGKMRKLYRKSEREEIITKHIHINANDLFKQIKQEGLAIPYKCPNCAGTLKITGKKRFETCPYCNSDLDLDTLSDLVEALL